MKFYNRLKTFVAVSFAAIILFSCSKSDDDGGGGTPQLSGYWKGNTTPPGNFTNPLNGLNFLIKPGSAVRVYYSSSQRPLNDTTTSDVLKQDGSYSLSGDDVTITTSKITCTGIKNSAFTSMQGTFRYTESGITLNQSFIVNK